MTTASTQGTHFWFMTIHSPDAAGVFMNSYQGTWTPEPDATRLDTFNAIRHYVDTEDARARGGIVTAFDIQPNEL
ncbi:hypothetical protein ABZ829_00590 [Streptomyces xanthochromogenes]|uniref:hypothetical protein n=1 Tax=Streptomyces xanthochromogenes TaxID=67384 RepID=UPI00342A9A33